MWRITERQGLLNYLIVISFSVVFGTFLTKTVSLPSLLPASVVESPSDVQNLPDPFKLNYILFSSENGSVIPSEL